jgi:hypothetical protein
MGGRNARLRSPSYGAAAFARRIAAGEGWWEVLVTLQFVASDFVLRHLIYRQAIGSLPRKWAENSRGPGES